MESLYAPHTYDNTPYFSLEKTHCFARVVDVYDGDTVKLIMPLPQSNPPMFFKFNCRLTGIDTSEMKSKQAENKERAVAARNLLITLCNKQVEPPIGTMVNKKSIKKFFNDNVCLVFVHCGAFDKYGRLLVDLYADPDSPNSFTDVLITNNMGYAYDGGKKKTEDEQAGGRTAVRLQPTVDQTRS